MIQWLKGLLVLQRIQIPFSVPTWKLPLSRIPVPGPGLHRSFLLKVYRCMWGQNTLTYEMKINKSLNVLKINTSLSVWRLNKEIKKQGKMGVSDSRWGVLFYIEWLWIGWLLFIMIHGQRCEGREEMVCPIGKNISGRKKLCSMKPCPFVCLFFHAV